MANDPSTPVPAVTPDEAELARIELALLGVEPATVSIDIGRDLAEQAIGAGRLTITDHEGAPLATFEVESATPTADGSALAGRVRRPPGTPGDGWARGPYASLRKPPAQLRLDAACIVVGRDPVDAHTLRAATAEPGRPVLFVVLDGPRPQPGPDVAQVVRSVLGLRDELRSGGRRAEVVVLPAAHQDDDQVLTKRIADAYGAVRVDVAQHPDLSAVFAWLDGRAAEPSGDWPAPSLRAWRDWRPLPPERGLVLLFTGLSGSGKSTVARAVCDRLAELGTRTTTLLDGDVVRRNLSAGLGFSRADRDRNIERIGFVAAQIARHGGIAVCAPIAPFAATRARVRRMAEAHGDFLLVHVATPLDECERRDRKGLYARARAGEIADFTGISSPYESPDDADLVLDTSELSVAEARDAVIELLRQGGRLT